MNWIKNILLYLALIFANGCVTGPREPLEGMTLGDELLHWNQKTSVVVPWGPSRAMFAEYVPPGETLQNWTRMITTITVDRERYDTPPTGLDQIAAMQSNYNEVCEKTSFGEPISGVENGYPTTLFYVACDMATSGPTAGSGDYTFVKVMEARINLFIVQRAWRGELPDPTVRPISDAEYAEWMRFFDDVQVALFSSKKVNTNE